MATSSTTFAVVVLFSFGALVTLADDGLKCESFENTVTNQMVHPNSWPEQTLRLNGIGAGVPQLKVGLAWCTKQQVSVPDADACSKPGYAQIYKDGKCDMVCDQFVQPPKMSQTQGQNYVTAYYQCFPESGAASTTLSLRISCAESESTLTGSSYSLQGSMIATQLGWSEPCGGTAPTESSKKGLTGGGVFVIIVFVGLAVYIIATVVFYAVKGRRGKELIPHREFWADLPFLVKDGCVFTFQRLRGLCKKGGGGGGYNSV